MKKGEGNQTLYEIEDDRLKKQKINEGLGPSIK
jgi:hypothetical protein